MQDLLNDTQFPSSDKERKEMEVKAKHDEEFWDGLFGTPSDAVDEHKVCV